MIPASLERARALIESFAPDAFSFDVFDTFLLRRTTRPDGVYERAFHHAPVGDGYRHMGESFVQHRELAERKARAASEKGEGISEISIERIYAQFPVRLFGLAPSSRGQLAEAEWQAEKDLCILNPEIYSLLGAARNRGIRTGFLSDTYWSSAQLRELLAHVAPGLEYDFLYASCEYGTGKSSGLFTRYLRAEKLKAARTMHIGDNPVADVKAPSALGVQTVYYPQCCKGTGDILEREKGAFQLLQSQCGGLSRRLDEGLTLTRRLATACLSGPQDVTQFTGGLIFGPLMTAFHYFIERQVLALSGEGKNTVILFLARDGHLPIRLWEKSDAPEGHYVAINRHIAMLGYADTVEALQEFFKSHPVLGDDSIHRFLSFSDFKIPAILDYFRKRRDKTITGKEFADILPSLVTGEEVATLSAKARKSLMDYLRANVPGFDAATDIVLVDVGYSGTIQRSFRHCLDKEGLEAKNLHGVYLACVDEKFAGLRESDSACGLINSTVMPPNTLLSMLRNVPLLDLLCSASTGSVTGYDGADVLYENDPRPAENMALCRKLQDACIGYFERYRQIVRDFRIDPLADAPVARAWSTAILTRFLLMPTPQEQEFFGAFYQDTSLGMQRMDMVSTREITRLMGAMDFSMLCALNNRPPWLAASMNSLSPLTGHAYAMCVFGLGKGTVFSDIPVGHVTATLIKEGKGLSVAGKAVSTAFGDIRIYIPVLRRDTEAQIAIPLEGLFSGGLLRSILLQEGDDMQDAMESPTLKSIFPDKVNYLKAQHCGPYFSASVPDAHMLIDIPGANKPLLIVIVTISPLSSSGQHEKPAPATAPRLKASR